jgi:hypothetical protein
MTVYFAWVDLVDGAAPPFTSAHHVMDEDVFAFEVTHAEGEFAQLSVEVRNTGGGLLNSGRKQWAWLSRDLGAGPVALFFGRVIGAPEDVGAETQRILLLARPPDWAAQKAALAETLRTLPAYDPVWISDAARLDPDVVLQARSAQWHTDRITGVMTISDHNVGEAGPVTVGHFRDSLDYRYSTAAIRRVTVTAEVAWDQTARGLVNIAPPLLQAFGDAGSRYAGFISTYTGEGLIRSWPEVGTRIGGGWEVGPITLTRVDGTRVPRQHLLVRTTDGSQGRFPLWEIRPTMFAAFDATRGYSERVSFTMGSGVQPLVTGIDEDAPQEISLSSSAVAEPDGDGIPIGDVRRRSYFQSDRGQQSLAHLVERARAILRAQARAVEIAVEVPFAEAAALSCRHSVTVVDSRLPGGTATGKVTEYAFGIDGESGLAFGRVTIGCTIGTGGTLSAAEGTPAYVDAGYVNDGWQVIDGQQVPLASNDAAWGFTGPRDVQDDGLDLRELRSNVAVVDLTVTNGPTAQAAAMVGPFDTLGEAAAAMNAVFTQVTLQMLPVDGYNFSTDYALDVTDLVLPRTIDLEAA